VHSHTTQVFPIKANSQIYVGASVLKILSGSNLVLHYFRRALEVNGGREIGFFPF
jgi:hypothetical protein